MSMEPTPINDHFRALMETEDDQPGAPFYDATLNYLQQQYNRTNSDIGRLTQKKFKIEDDIETREGELETIRNLLIEEWRERKPANPDTGELIDAPFGED